MYTIHWTMCIWRYVHCTMYSVHIVYCTTYSVHCTCCHNVYLYLNLCIVYQLLNYIITRLNINNLSVLYKRICLSVYFLLLPHFVVCTIYIPRFPSVYTTICMVSDCWCIMYVVQCILCMMYDEQCTCIWYNIRRTTYTYIIRVRLSMYIFRRTM